MGSTNKNHDATGSRYCAAIMPMELSREESKIKRRSLAAERDSSGQGFAEMASSGLAVPSLAPAVPGASQLGHQSLSVAVPQDFGLGSNGVTRPAATRPAAVEAPAETRHAAVAAEPRQGKPT